MFSASLNHMGEPSLEIADNTRSKTKAYEFDLIFQNTREISTDMKKISFVYVTPFIY